MLKHNEHDHRFKIYVETTNGCDIILWQNKYFIAYIFDLELLRKHKHGKDTKGYSSSASSVNGKEKKKFRSSNANRSKKWRRLVR